MGAPRRVSRYVVLHVTVMNVLARAFGVLACLTGAYALLARIVSTENRRLMVVVGMASIVAGVAFIMVKPIEPTDLVTEEDRK